MQKSLQKAEDNDKSSNRIGLLIQLFSLPGAQLLKFHTPKACLNGWYPLLHFAWNYYHLKNRWIPKIHHSWLGEVKMIIAISTWKDAKKHH